MSHPRGLLCCVLWLCGHAAAQQRDCGGPPSTAAEAAKQLDCANQLRDDEDWRGAERIYQQILTWAARSPEAKEFRYATELNYAYQLDREWKATPAGSFTPVCTAGPARRTDGAPKARQHYQVAAESNDWHTASLARNNLGMLLVEGGSYQEARDQLRKIAPPPEKTESNRALATRFRFNLGIADFELAKEHGKRDLREEAFESFADSIRARADLNRAFGCAMRMGDLREEFLPRVKELVSGAISEGNASEWGDSIRAELRSGYGPKAENILLALLTQSYEAAMPSIDRFACEDWPDLSAVAKAGKSRFRERVSALGSIFGPTTCEGSPKTAFDIPAFQRELLGALQEIMDDDATVAGILKQAGDQWEQRCLEKGSGCKHSEALDRYRAAWLSYPEGAEAAYLTAAILKNYRTGPSDAYRDSLKRELHDRYSFPPGIAPRTWRWIRRVARGTLDRTFDDYRSADLNTICSMYDLLRATPDSAGAKPLNYPKCEPGSDSRVAQELSDRKEKPLGLPAPVDGSKVVHGATLAAAGTKSGVATAEPLKIVNVEVHTYWPEGVNSSRAVIDPDTHELTARFRRRLVTGQWVSFRDYGTGKPLPELPAEVAVAPRIVPGAGIGDWGSTREYVRLGWSVVPRNVADVANLYFSFTVDHNLATWGGRRLLMSRGAREKGAPVVWGVNLFATGEVAPVSATGRSSPGQNGAVTLIQPMASRTVTLGVYAPIFPNQRRPMRQFWRPGVYNYHNRPYATYVAPLFKMGVDSLHLSDADRPLALRTGSLASFVAYGARFGTLRYVVSDTAVSPAELFYVDAVYGRWSRLAVPDGSGSRIDGRLEISGVIRIPKTIAFIGFTSNMGKGIYDNRITFGATFDAGWVAAKLSRQRGTRPFPQQASQ